MEQKEYKMGRKQGHLDEISNRAINRSNVDQADNFSALEDHFAAQFRLEGGKNS